MGLCSATASIVCAYVRTQQGRVSAAHIQKMISLLFFLFLLFLPVLFLIVFLSKIKKMKPVDSEEPQNTPIEDTTESIKSMHKIARPGAKPTRTNLQDKRSKPDGTTGKSLSPRTEPAPERNKRG